MTNHKTTRNMCPTCMGKKVIDGICEVDPEWVGIKTADQEACTSENTCSGQLCTPDAICPTCNGKGYVN